MSGVNGGNVKIHVIRGENPGQDNEDDIRSEVDTLGLVKSITHEIGV